MSEGNSQLNQVDRLVKAALKLQTTANKSSVSEKGVSILASADEREAQEKQAFYGKHHAGQILDSLAALVDMIEPSVKLGRKVAKNKSSLLKDLTGLPSASAHYSDCVEQVCDDLLEMADKQIDLVG